ncbi:hypothetical protein [Marivita sp. XM-24bin2]|mgnify:CR=1 FL=1|jgi:hypothetical protein|uniref:hypothetical protein n=1 Tax=unclassified Marivita TaxID=2632480 RepID=UPI000D7AC2AF|nr:hypothetical protein [Marivita sp. XM-24bin2]MCR9107896.1 hypothetical protein [Paracoccaceae bacterium]PWL34598.1 MAG: hypothetical protein DCO97_13465 [Marivita sp. XM-24bin2]
MVHKGARVSLLITTLAATPVLAQTYSVPGGSISIDPSGQFSGSISETYSEPGYEETSNSTVSGSISPSGDISGSFQGTVTFSDGSGTFTDSYSGDIQGTITDDGQYQVQWSGPEPGTDSGVLPGFSLPAVSEPDPPLPDEPPVPDEPAVPDEPTVPDEPPVPDEPTVPDEPPVPDEPTPPDEPDVPDEPTVPDEPPEPEDPDEPTEPTTPLPRLVSDDEDGPRRERAQKALSAGESVISAIVAGTDPTEAITQRLNNIQRICETMGDEYQVACFAVTYKDLANAIRETGGDPEIGRALNEAADKLDQLVRGNLDRQKPALRAHLDTPSGTRIVTTPPMRAVRAPEVADLKRRAADILEQAETVLLRSATTVGPTRSLSFQRVAAAINSNKVLLRSS